MNVTSAAAYIDLMRHGDTMGGERYRGSTDDVLSALGWEQMRAATGNGAAWTRIVSSPLKRCAEFANELSQHHNTPIGLDPRLSEIHFGDWEGKTATELVNAYPELLARFWNDPVANPPPNGESLPIFEARILAAWNEHINQAPGERLLIVTHGGPIRTILGYLQGLSWPDRMAIAVPHASLTRVWAEADSREPRPESPFSMKLR